MNENIPTRLMYEDVELRYDKTVPGDAEGKFVPFHHFRVVYAGIDVGHINFKVGDTEHVRLVAGHIGYEIREEFRGKGFAYKACRALAPLVRQIYGIVIMTADPGNFASKRVMEKIGARYLDEIDVPERDPAFAAGARRKVRYEWMP